MGKRGGIWVSAILYVAMGVVLLTIILAAGLPAIQKMKDSYTAKQTKDLMLRLDDNIRTVFHEGPSSQRTVSLNIGRGEFIIDEEDDLILWNVESSAIISEIGVPVTEGNLQVLTSELGIKDKYRVDLQLNYSVVGLNLTYEGPQKLSGNSKFSILNKGGDPINIAITQL